MEIKKWIVVFAILFLIIFSTVLHAEEKQGVLQIDLTMNPGVYPKKIFGTMYPSYSIWVEDAKTKKATTIFVSKKLGNNKWYGAKARPSAGPVWEGIKANEAGFNADAVSSATPKDSQNLKWPIPKELKGKKLNVFLEANCSFDYNETYKKTKEGEPGFSTVNGQPSLIWKATFAPGDQPIADLEPKLVGHGQVLGKDHEIHPDYSAVTTAREIFKSIEMKYVVNQ